MKIIWLLLLLGVGMKNLSAQNAYDYWLQQQEAETHLRAAGNYQIKETYGSQTGQRKDLQLVQRQRYQAGYLREDEGYIDGNKVYHVVMQLPEGKGWEQLAQEGIDLAGLEVVGLNVLDSTTSTYSFEGSGLLNYYVVDQQGNRHTIYTYNDKKHLLHYKDCLAPFGNDLWCAYYVYQYNKKDQLIEARSYNLEQGQPITQKELFAIDSMVYNSAEQLIERWTLDSTGIATQRALYHYNKEGLLCEETSTQWPIMEGSHHYQKVYCYRPNGRLKIKEERYFWGDNLQARQRRVYNAAGNVKKQAAYKRDKQPVRLYLIRYQ